MTKERIHVHGRLESRLSLEAHRSHATFGKGARSRTSSGRGGGQACDDCGGALRRENGDACRDGLGTGARHGSGRREGLALERGLISHHRNRGEQDAGLGLLHRVTGLLEEGHEHVVARGARSHGHEGCFRESSGLRIAQMHARERVCVGHGAPTSAIVTENNKMIHTE